MPARSRRGIGSTYPFGIHLLVLVFHRVQRYYRQVATVLWLGQIPPPPMSESTLVIVPVAKVSRLTAQAVSEVLSLGDEVVAVTVAMGPIETTDQQADPDRCRSPAVHIGAIGILGVLVQDPTTQRLTGHRAGRRYGAVSSGALIAGVIPGSPADQAGLAAGDDIVSADAATVDSPATLTTLLTGHHPGDTMRLTWIDVLGQRRTATLRLATGPPN